MYRFFRELWEQSSDKQSVSRLPISSVGSMQGFEFLLLFIQKRKEFCPTVLQSLNLLSLLQGLFSPKGMTLFTLGWALCHIDFFFFPVNFGVVIFEPSVAKD